MLRRLRASERNKPSTPRTAEASRQAKAHAHRVAKEGIAPSRSCAQTNRHRRQRPKSTTYHVCAHVPTLPAPPSTLSFRSQPPDATLRSAGPKQRAPKPDHQTPTARARATPIHAGGRSVTRLRASHKRPASPRSTRASLCPIPMPQGPPAPIQEPSLATKLAVAKESTTRHVLRRLPRTTTPRLRDSTVARGQSGGIASVHARRRTRALLRRSTESAQNTSSV